jgi:transposase InsO family protein
LKEGWLYVASVMNSSSRKKIGWHANKQMTKELVITPLDRAYQRQQPPKGILRHLDRGSQYASHIYQD